MRPVALPRQRRATVAGGRLLYPRPNLNDRYRLVDDVTVVELTRTDGGGYRVQLVDRDGGRRPADPTRSIEAGQERARWLGAELRVLP